MKILYLAFIRLPTEKAHGVQIMKTCEALAIQGAEVDLVIPGRKTLITDDPFTFYGVQKNFSITNLKTPDFLRLGSFGFAIGALWFAEVAKWQKSFWNADVIFSRDAFVLIQYVLLRRKTVYEAHTTPTFISRLAARYAYRVVVISEGLKTAYSRAGIPESKILVAHDAIDLGSFTVAYDKAVIRKNLGLPENKIIALYVGRIDEAKGAKILAEASKHVPDTHTVALIGPGPLRDELKRAYPKAIVLAETPYRDLPKVLASADILIAPNSARDADASQYTSPLKAFAYLAAKRPIIASDVPALRTIFGATVVYVKADDPKALAAAIEDPQTISILPTAVPLTWLERAQKILTHLHAPH